MPDARLVEQLIEDNLKNDEYVDVRGLAKSFNVEVKLGRNTDSTVVGRFFIEAESRVMLLNESLNDQEQNTVIALLLGLYCLNDNKLREEGYSVNVFDLKGIRQNRFSRLMYLATRFAIPEKIIQNMDEITLMNKKIAASDHFTSDFIFSSVKGHTISFLLDNHY